MYIIQVLIILWLRSIFHGNGDEVDKSTKFILVATPLIVNFTFTGLSSERASTALCHATILKLKTKVERRETKLASARRESNTGGKIGF